MRVGRENLREGVTHLKLPIDCSVKESLIWVETPILKRPFCGRRPFVIMVCIREASFEVLRIFGERRQFTFVVLCLLKRLQSITERDLSIHNFFCLLPASHNMGRDNLGRFSATVCNSLEVRFFAGPFSAIVN